MVTGVALPLLGTTMVTGVALPSLGTAMVTGVALPSLGTEGENQFQISVDSDRIIMKDGQ